MRPWAPSTRAADMGSVPTCRPVLVPGPACMTCTHRPPQASWWASTPPHRPDPEGLCFCVPAPRVRTGGCSVCAEPTAQQEGPGPGLRVSHELLPQHPQHMAAQASDPGQLAQRQRHHHQEEQHWLRGPQILVQQPRQAIGSSSLEVPKTVPPGDPCTQWEAFPARRVSNSPSPVTHLQKPNRQHLPLSSSWGA